MQTDPQAPVTGNRPLADETAKTLNSGYPVVIAGGGPTGLMLAAELALAGVEPLIVERRQTQALEGSRAGGLLTRTLEVLDQRGVAERFIAAGQVHPTQMLLYSKAPEPLLDLPTRHNYTLALWQSQFEQLMADWVAELGVPTLRSTEVLGFRQDDAGVEVRLTGGKTLQAGYLVGCDGGRSRIRKAAGIAFTGWDPTTSWMIAEVEMEQEPPFGFRHDSSGTHAINRRAPGEPIRLVLTEPRLVTGEQPDLAELRAALVAIYATDFGLRSARWISRFTDITRQATAYRQGRVLLAGDAAHIHPPQGGQGLNTGVQDAVNLGWKLAQVVKGESPASLLDSYHSERHPVAARVLQHSLAAVALGRPDDRHQALRDVVTGLMHFDAPRRSIVTALAGLDIAYADGEGHPVCGRRMPDLDLQTADGPRRVYQLLHAARPLLLQFSGPPAELAPWAGRVRGITARGPAVWELPVLGEVPAPAAVLIRPDGHVAWAGEPSEAGLAAALRQWFGPPAD